MKNLIALALLTAALLAACEAKPVEVEVTRIVKVEVEIIREVEVPIEVEVTRIVEVLVAAELVTPQPSDLEVIAVEWSETTHDSWDVDVTVLVRNNSSLALVFGGDILGYIEVKCLRADGGPASQTTTKFVEAAPGEEAIRDFIIDLEFDFTCDSVDVQTEIR